MCALTCVAPWTAPCATSERSSLFDAPTRLVSLRPVASAWLMVSAVARVMSPLFRMLVTTLAFTVSHSFEVFAVMAVPCSWHFHVARRQVLRGTGHLDDACSALRVPTGPGNRLRAG